MPAVAPAASSSRANTSAQVMSGSGSPIAETLGASVQGPFEDDSEEEDVLLCGRCKEKFTEIAAFAEHKESNECRTARRLTTSTATQVSAATSDAQVETTHTSRLPQNRGVQTFERRLKGRPLRIEYLSEDLFKSFTGKAEIQCSDSYYFCIFWDFTHLSFSYFWLPQMKCGDHINIAPRSDM